MWAEEFASQVVAVGWAWLTFAVLCLLLAVGGGVVEWRRKWPHGYGRTCQRPLCPCWPSQVARWRRKDARLERKDARP